MVVCFLLQWMLVSEAYAQPQCANGEASAFRYPLDNWKETCGFGVHCARDHHMGVDGVSTGRSSVVGTPVYAPCTGKIREAQFHNGYGGMVIVECWTGTECVTPFAAHMFAMDTLIEGVQYYGLQVIAGGNVQMGQLVGYLADFGRNGGWDPHSHFGIRKGVYSSFSYQGCLNDFSGPQWSYGAYPGGCYQQQEPDMHNPNDFIAGTINANTGLETSGLADLELKKKLKIAFVAAYTQHGNQPFFGPPSAVGTNTTVYVHAWGTDIANRPLLVQDFLRPLLGGRSYWSQLQYNRTLGTALPVHGKILEMYARCKNDGSCISNYPSTHDFGAPRNTEYYCVLPTFTYYRPGQEEHFALNRFVRQDFDNIFIG